MGSIDSPTPPTTGGGTVTRTSHGRTEIWDHEAGEWALMVPDFEDGRRRSVLFNDITHSPLGEFYAPLSIRLAIRDYLWEQGWRRDVRPEDVTES